MSLLCQVFFGNFIENKKVSPKLFKRHLFYLFVKSYLLFVRRAKYFSRQRLLQRQIQIRPWWAVDRIS